MDAELTLTRLHHVTALNNALNHYHLDVAGYNVHEFQQQDKRKTKPLYFLTDSKGNSLTGILDYSELNNFIRGYGIARSSTHDVMLKALKTAIVVIERISDEYSEVAHKHASFTRGEYNLINNAILNADPL